MFEPESAPAVATDNAFASAADAMIKESEDTGFEQQSVFSKSPGIEKPTPENSPSATKTDCKNQCHPQQLIKPLAKLFQMESG